jgi:hypothetical protein
MLLIDYYLKKGDFEKSLKQINLVDKSIGGDPCLNTIRANIQFAAGNFDKARQLGEQIREELPDMTAGYWLPVNIALKEMKYDDVLAGLKAIRLKFNVTFGDLSTYPDYAGFAKSPQYQEWLAFEKGE